jgi:hypothetical protein
MGKLVSGQRGGMWVVSGVPEISSRELKCGRIASAIFLQLDNHDVSAPLSTSYHLHCSISIDPLVLLIFLLKTLLSLKFSNGAHGKQLTVLTGFCPVVLYRTFMRERRSSLVVLEISSSSADMVHCFDSNVKGCQQIANQKEARFGTS